MRKKREVPEGKTSVQINIDNSTHLKIVNARAEKFKKKKTIADLCASLVEKFADKL